MKVPIILKNLQRLGSVIGFSVNIFCENKPEIKHWQLNLARFECNQLGYLRSDHPCRDHQQWHRQVWIRLECICHWRLPNHNPLIYDQFTSETNSCKLKINHIESSNFLKKNPIFSFSHLVYLQCASDLPQSSFTPLCNFPHL